VKGKNSFSHFRKKPSRPRDSFFEGFSDDFLPSFHFKVSFRLTFGFGIRFVFSTVSLSSELCWELQFAVELTGLDLTSPPFPLD
jgi:hypothetical protein